MLTLFITPKHRVLILEFILRVFVQIIHCDRWLLCTALALNGRWCPLISYGVISSRLPSLIRLGTVTLQATTTKHARQVWLLPSVRSISNCLTEHLQSSTAEQSTQTLQSKVTDGLASFALSQSVTAFLKSSLTV